MSLEPWQLGNYPGSRHARELRPENLPRWLKNDGTAIVVVGDRVSMEGSEGAFYLEAAKKLIKKGIYTVATPKAYGKLSSEGTPPNEYASVPEIIKKITDEKFPNLETVMLFGIRQYYFQSQALQALKHNWSGRRVLSLDPYFQPSAAYSSPNISRKKIEEWQQE
ncbi:MAG: carbon monoxide dehydrogenase beta subunit family protein, partial [Candidatus Hodarchaeota archaeon]